MKIDQYLGILGLSAKSSRFCEGRVCEMHIAAAQ